MSETRPLMRRKAAKDAEYAANSQVISFGRIFNAPSSAGMAGNKAEEIKLSINSAIPTKDTTI